MSALEARLSALVATPREHAGQRVVTLRQVDEFHGASAGRARTQFNRLVDRLVNDPEDNGQPRPILQAGVHFFRAPRASDDSVPSVSGTRGNFSGLPSGDEILLTEVGYATLAKSFNDDRAWLMHEKLVTCYFRVRPLVDQALAALVGEVASLRAEVAQERADRLAARRDAFEASRSVGRLTSAFGAGLAEASRVSPRTKVIGQEDPAQGRMFLTVEQTIEDRARNHANRITPTEAAVLLNVSVRQLGRLAKAGTVERRFPCTKRPYLIEHVQRALVPASESVAS